MQFNKSNYKLQVHKNFKIRLNRDRQGEKKKLQIYNY